MGRVNNSFRTRFSITIVALVLSTSSYSKEQENEKQKFENFYLGIRLGEASFKNAGSNSDDSCNNTSIIAGLYAGIQITSWLDIEANITNYDTVDDSYAEEKSLVDMNSFDLSTRLSYSLRPKWQLFTRFGISQQYIDKYSTKAEQKHDKVRGAIGALGVIYRWLPQWSIRGEYQFINRIGNSDLLYSDLHSYSLGFS